MRFIALLVLAILGQVAVGQSLPPSPAAREALRNCSVMIQMVDRSASKSADEDRAVASCGTGTLVARGRLLFTNRHVGGRDLVRELASGTHEGQRFRIDVSSLSGPVELGNGQRDGRFQDITTFRVRSSRESGIDRFVAFKDLEPGQPVWTLGNPNCHNWIMSGGLILGVPDSDSTDKTSREVMEFLNQATQANTELAGDNYRKMIIVSGSLATNGNSGGPVVDQYGRLIGIVWSKIEPYVLVIPVDLLFESAGIGRPATTQINEPKTIFSRGRGLSSYIQESRPEVAAIPQPENTATILLRYREVTKTDDLYQRVLSDQGIAAETNPRILRLNYSASSFANLDQITVSTNTAGERTHKVRWQDHVTAPADDVVAFAGTDGTLYLLLPETANNTARMELTLRLSDGTEYSAFPERR